jgi:hypothetical protein
MLWHGEVVRSSGSVGEDAHLVDEVRDELAAADLEYLHGLAGGLECGATADLIARRTVAVNQAPHLLYLTEV